jgi:dihydropteroate synthase
VVIPKLMGIVNATPDSFYGASRASEEQGVALGLRLAAQGAHLLDIGGESTRPGALLVPFEEEIRRVVPVIAGLRAAGCTLPLSIDTRKYETAFAAHAAGATWLNDVAALEDDERLGRFAAETGMTVVLMHRQGNSETMQKDPRYAQVGPEIRDALARRVEAALAAGIHPEHLVLDPGIGFGKTLDHTLELMQALPLFSALGFPLLLGLSRKSFLALLEKRAGQEAPPAEQRLAASLAAALAASEAGVEYLRVHDVAETAQALRTWEALKPRGETWTA